MSDVLIRLSGVAKNYTMGDTVVHALYHVSLTFDKGEFIAIMGASGSGKSTLLNILGCLDVPDAGEYMFDGEETEKLTANQLTALRNRKIGFVFQAFNLLPRTTAIENVELPLLYNRGVDTHEARRKSLESLEQVGLQDRKFHYSNQLSGGQQQRVAIARAIVNDPVIVLADEPTGNLDSQISVDIMGVFQHLNRNGITIIMVTHEQDIAQFALRKVTFRDGSVMTDEPVRNRRNAAEELTKRVFGERRGS
jgi:putative ABC transport system ATP-binding protein